MQTCCFIAHPLPFTLPCGWQAAVAQDSFLDDYNLLKEYYASGKSKTHSHHPKFAKIREEALDLRAHVTKVPSFLAFRMCAGDESTWCKRCKEICASEGISPNEVLAPIKFNNYHLLFPQEAGSGQILAPDLANQNESLPPSIGTLFVPQVCACVLFA
jgi:hypothetical protein